MPPIEQHSESISVMDGDDLCRQRTLKVGGSSGRGCLDTIGHRVNRNIDGQKIYFHALCVESWTLRSCGDALEIRCHGKPCWNQLKSNTRADETIDAF